MSFPQKFVWLWRRLSVMGPSEVLSRIVDQLYLLSLRFRHKKPPVALPDEPPGSSATREFAVASFEFDQQKLKADFPMLLEGHIPYGGGDWHFDEGADAWHREHTSLRTWPQVFFNALNYRPGNPVGDARRTWEPARLQQLVALAVRSDDVGLELSDAESALALTMIERQLTSWWIHNPVLHGIHYVSAMECGLRCMAMAHTASFLEDRGRLSARVRAIVLATLEQHADFIRKRISSHSSAGNHTLAECAGLIYASLLLPERRFSPADERFAVDLFTREFDRQVVGDGGGLEQATWYHRFNVELAECVVGTLAANGRRVPEVLATALARASRFLRALTTPNGETIRLGDADDGYALSPYVHGRWRHYESAPVQTFTQTGVTCARIGDWQLVIDHGPLGMPPSYGHGHADALSLVAYYRGSEVLCDSGTGAYSSECSALRAHFRSCAAHNTVQVGKGDFARAISPFMWTEPYRCTLLQRHEADGVLVLGMRLEVDTSETHFRVDRYVSVSASALTVADRVVTTSTQRATQRWLMSDAVKREGNQLFVADENLLFALSGPDSDTVTLNDSQVSPAYGELRAVQVASQQSDATPDEPLWLLMRMTVSGSSSPETAAAGLEGPSDRSLSMQDRASIIALAEEFLS